VDGSSDAEVHNLGPTAGLDHDVLGFEIAMDDTQIMGFDKTFDDLSGDVDRLSFLELSLSFD
jgi:hypothetical protein